MRIAEIIDALELTATSHDEQVGADLRGRYDVRFWIAPGHAARVGERRLGEQLGQAATALIRARAAAIGRAKNLTGARAARTEGGTDVEGFQDALERTTVEASSPDGLVTVRAIGPAHVTFEVRAGAIAEHGQDEVARAATEAARAGVPRLVGEVRQLRRDFYRG